MKTIVRHNILRAFIALMVLASSSLVLEAGQRWK